MKNIKTLRKLLINIIFIFFVVLNTFSNIYAEDLDLVFVKGKDGKQYWYEKNIKQGVYGQKGNVWYDGTERGREIYDPKTDGWYWLDCIYDGAKAQSKEVFMPYVYQDEKNWYKDDKRVNEVAKLSNNMSNQIKEAIKNKSGKWVRYDASGKMIKGWYENNNGRYYYDKQTGAMAKGQLNIEGNWYMFDPITGVMVKGFYNHTSQTDPDGDKTVYYDENGIMLHGQQYIDENWYMFDLESGAMAKGFYKHTKKTEPTGPKTVYYDENGQMVHGQKNIGKYWYMFDKETGEMITGFYNLSGEEELSGKRVVYYDDKGRMLFGNQTIEKNDYRFNEESGALEEVNYEPFVEGLKLSRIDTELFTWKDGIASYPEASFGIDVSSHQGTIDWQKVKNDGVEFVYLRAAWRAWGPSGALYNDARFEYNYTEAKKVGLKVGVYVFSQAINEDEAREEANRLLELTNGKQMDLPYCFDLETGTLGDEVYRANGASPSSWTNSANAFLDVMHKAGKKAILYVYGETYEKKFYMSRLQNYDEIWYAYPDSFDDDDKRLYPPFPFEYNIWQYSFKGRIAGINGKNIDLNIKFK